MADTVKLSELFAIEYGNQLDLNKLETSGDGINFVSRSSSNLGITAKVCEVSDIKPYESGLITATLGGTYLLSAFVQPAPFYTAQNIKVLKPLSPMSFNEKIFYCLAIAHNRFRYTSHGREANKTFDDLLVPRFESLPNWVNGSSVAEPSIKRLIESQPPLNIDEWQEFRYDEIFDIRKGRRLTKAQLRPGATPFIGAIEDNNGYRQFVDVKPDHPGNTITVNYNGNGVAEAFYQPQPFWASDDVNVLYPKFELNPFRALFLCALIRKEKFRFSYGRKWGLSRMTNSTVRLPVKVDGSPDWEAMENHIKSLPYSSSVTAG